MSAAPLAHASTRRAPSPNQLAHDIADRVRDTRQISHATRLCFTVLVRARDGNSYAELTLDKIARQLPGRVDGHKSISSVKNHLRDLEAAGLIWRQGRRIYITSIEPRPIQEAIPDDLTLEALSEQCADAMHAGDFTLLAMLASQAAELKAVDQHPIFCAPDQTTFCPRSDNFLPPPSFNEISQGSQEALRPGGESSPAQPEVFVRDEPVTGPSAEALRDAGVQSDAWIRRLAPRYSAEKIRDTAELLRADPSTRDVGGLLVEALERGVFRYRYRRQTESSQARAAPMPQERDYSAYLNDGPNKITGSCDACGTIIRAMHDGQCPKYGCGGVT